MYTFKLNGTVYFKMYKGDAISAINYIFSSWKELPFFLQTSCLYMEWCYIFFLNANALQVCVCTIYSRHLSCRYRSRNVKYHLREGGGHYGMVVNDGKVHFVTTNPFGKKCETVFVCFWVCGLHLKNVFLSLEYVFVPEKERW